MRTGLRSLLISAGTAFEDAVADAACCVDTLPNCNEQIAKILIDWLSSEMRIPLPPPLPEDRTFSCRGITSLRRHDACVLYTRLRKQEIDPLSTIAISYGLQAEGGIEWADYLCRLKDHFHSDDSRLVIVVAIPTILDDSVYNHDGQNPRTHFWRQHGI